MTTPFLDLHTQKAPDRSKLRIRAYGSPPSGPAFFEVKRKVKRVTFKDRAVVPMEALPALLNGEIPSSAYGSSPQMSSAHSNTFCI